MKLKKLKKLKKLIWDIYYNNEDPKKFFDATGMDNYLEELYPPEEDKLVGDWIKENIGDTIFFNASLLETYFSDNADRIKKVIFYANLPTK